MADRDHTRLSEKIERAIRERPRREALYRAVKRGRDSRNAAIEALPGGDAFRREVRAIKLRCLERQEDLVGKFTRKARERGTSVFLAKDGAEAIGYILKIAAGRGTKVVAKSKSLTSEEIDVNTPMEEAGIEVIETDLGELIIQKAGERPFHLVFPAIHKTVREIADIFTKVTGEEIPPEDEAVMKVVRGYLRPIFLNADIGMTGANVGIAENGAIVIETNEGNARLVSSIPDVHICIMGREKIVDTVEDSLHMIFAHPISAVGQHLTTYVTFLAGRSPLGEAAEGEARESHIIILDNGRTRMARDPLFRDALNCIRCGACMNICPTYGVTGGHTFGHIYPGPIGIPWTAQVHGLEEAAGFASLCIACDLCKEICPVEIDIPMMITAVKDMVYETRSRPGVNRILMASEAFAKLGSATAPLSNMLLRNRPFRRAMETVLGIDRRREIPPFHRSTLAKRFRKREPSTLSDPAFRAVFFTDLYANYNAPELGMAAIEYLEERGCEVTLPAPRWCGYPFIGYGDLKKARRIALENVRFLLPYAEKGYYIVATEPTAAYCLRISYPKLMEGDRDAEIVAGRTHDLFGFAAFLEKEVPPRDMHEAGLEGRRLGYYIPCHQRPLGTGGYTAGFLRRCGAEVKLIDSGTCCGMAGTFGLKKGMLGYELSQAVGDPLFQSFKEAGVDTIVTESSVCRIHLKEGTGLDVRHPLELLARTHPEIDL